MICLDTTAESWYTKYVTQKCMSWNLWNPYYTSQKKVNLSIKGNKV